MLLIILGLIIWIAAHAARRLAPNIRQSLEEKLGSGAKGVMALAIVAGLVLMIVGYRNAAEVPLWVPPLWLTHVNNLLMIVALWILLTTVTKPGTAFIMGSMKNPQLTGFKIWAFAHLLVNGDLASVVLFGGLLLWAVLQVIIAKRTPQAELVNPDAAPISSPWVHLALVVVVFLAVTFAHNWLGVWPFGRS